MLVLSVGSGPTDARLDFSFRGRADGAVLGELAASLSNLRRVVPAGMVVFFPSYAMEEQFHAHCSATQTLGRLGVLFRGSTFSEYTQAVHRGERATLWAVVGGSLSEGINFADDLGRCVVVVGVPFPNAHDVVLQERVARLGQEHYTALAARALNQSIGRAIRHARDYACVVLLDARYEDNGLARAWLPQWMQQSLVPTAPFGPSIARVSSFFRGHRTAEASRVFI